MAGFFPLDQGLLFWIQEELRTPALNAFFLLLTTLGNGGLLWIACSGIMLFFQRWRKAGILALVSMLLTFVTGELLLKHIIARPRPFLELEGLMTLLPGQGGFSFPSGHTASSFAAAGLYLREVPVRWIRVLFLAMAVLMGLSRLYVGVHYPTDVLAGAALGLLWSQIVWKLSGIFCKLQNTGDES